MSQISKYDKLKKQSEKAFSKVEESISQRDKAAEELKRMADISYHAGEIISDLDKQFVHVTKLNKIDIAFLFLATALQCTRQYVLTAFPERLDNQTAAEQTAGHQKEHSNRHHRYYNPSLEEILTNPVPFDANVGSDGALSGGGKLGHRVTAIGHDPVLGLIFGTANIATSTLTTYTFDSYHIGTNDLKRDYFMNKARTDLVLEKTVEKLLYCGLEGKTIVGAALLKEIIHLKSDVNTKHSLPLPFVSAINPKTASELAKYGLDMSNVLAVGKQATYSIFLNSVIAMIHGLFYDGVEDKKLYEVRTRKILSYSNSIASGSNVIYVALSKDMKKLDIGGMPVTLYRLLNDYTFIQKVKLEFMEKRWYDIVMGDDFFNTGGQKYE